MLILPANNQRFEYALPDSIITSVEGAEDGVARFTSLVRAKDLLIDAFNKTEYNEVPLTRRSALFMDSIVMSTEGVIKLLKGLIPSKALGPDDRASS